MKYLFHFLLLFSVNAAAQITITNNDFSNMFTVGNEITIKENENGASVDIGQPGGGNAWDFSWFTGTLEMVISVIDPATSPYINEFPGANIATYSLGEFEGEEGEIWSYSNLNGVLGNLGSAITVTNQPGNLITAKYNPPRIEAELPLTFNSAWSETYSQIIYFNGSPFIQSSVSINVIVDAYGTMTLPGGAIFEALRIRESMTVDGQTTTVSYMFLSENGAQVTVNAVSSNPPNSGVIAAESYSWNSEFSGGGGSLVLTVSHPGSNDIVIAGERDSIKYRFYEGDVDLYYSLDEGQNYVLIDSNYNEFGGVYYWDVPESLLTTKAKIKVIDSSPDSAESGVFNIKPWQLTRITNDAFELYEPDQDGWNFCNCTSNMWPQTWWQQFDYIGGTDPYTSLPYPPYFFTTSSIAFPDWPLFVDVFTESVCYKQTPIGKIYRTRPLVFWIATVKPWAGSCFGFAVSSLLGFYHKEHLIQLIGNFGNLNSVSINTETSYVVNSFQIYQKDKEYRNERRNNRNKTARDLLTELKEMLIKENGDGRVLAYWDNNGSGGHAVVPYKLERASGLSKFNVTVYNPNRPDSINEFIYIDSVANTWSDSTSLGFGTGTTGCVLERISESFLYTPNLKPSEDELSLGNSIDTSRITVYNTIEAEIMITSSTGEQIGYQDSIAFNNMTDALPMIPLTGYFHPPIGYDLPQDSYTLEINNFTDSTSRVLFDEEITVYHSARYNVNNNETDLFRYSENGIKIINPDTETKNIDLITIITEDTISEKVFFTSNLGMQSDDSINIKEKDRSELILNNYGPVKNYELRIIDLSEDGYYVFENSSIPISQNSGHQIVPDWNDLQNEPVKILIDLGNDGTIDDSIFVQNQATSVEDGGSLLSPDSYKLAQNYPNPFNPITTIRYSIPESGNVSLKVYDILGNEVASLVNEEKARGVYSVTFDASNLSSGVYFYKIQAGNYFETKKMLLIK